MNKCTICGQDYGTTGPDLHQCKNNKTKLREFEERLDNSIKHGFKGGFDKKHLVRYHNKALTQAKQEVLNLIEIDEDGCCALCKSSISSKNERYLEQLKNKS